MPHVSLTILTDALRDAGLLQRASGPTDLDITHLAHDSRKVGPNGLFVAVRGLAADGHVFIDQTVQQGAIAIVGEAVPAKMPAGVASLTVADSRAAVAELAAAFYGHPSHQLSLIGITGTNGKTTSAFLLYEVLRRLGHTAGLIGTVEHRVGTTVLPSDMTTPDAIAVQQLLREMVDAGCTAAAMEVSSHALDQDRVRAVRFAAGVFTNLTHDHLDYHGTVEDYLEAKRRLFDHLEADAVAVINHDDPAGPSMIERSAASARSFGRRAGADIELRILSNTIEGLRLSIDGRERQFRLVGAFNAYNLAGAYAVCKGLGYDPDAILDALADAPAPPGRFETVEVGQPVTVVVDYAHTPDALENVLRTARAVMPRSAKLWCVFGCGGDRDPDKRTAMGLLAETLADVPVVTSDNPRTEDPEAILAQIRSGMARPDDAVSLVSRRDAIRYAAAQAAPGDVVLIAGKGHETYQVIGTEKIHFDDREEARLAFA